MLNDSTCISDDKKTKICDKINKNLGKKKVYNFSGKVDSPPKMFQQMKSLGYKESVNIDKVKNGEVRYYIKDIEDYYMNVIVSIANDNEITIVVQYVESDKVKPEVVKLFK